MEYAVCLKTMTISSTMEQLKNKVIEIENEVRYYDEQQYLDCCDYSGQIDTLLKLRKKLIDRYVIDHLDKYLDKICEFDERLTDAFRADFEKRKNIMNDVENVLGDSKELEFSLFLAEDATQKPFELFFNHFSYDDSYVLSGIGYAKSFRSKIASKTVQTFDDTERAAKESRELFMNRPLSSSFYYLFEETNFSLLDIIYVRSFYSWTTIRVMNEYTTHQKSYVIK